MTVPAYLRDHAQLYAQSPREAALTWFRQARYGLFLHYGLYSLLGRHEWVMLNERIRPGDYAALAHHFTAHRFDANAIADFALECGMKYINITTRHHDSFCLWPTQTTSFHVGHSPCRRDLVAELAEACEARGLGLFLYFSHGRDWKHPHAPHNQGWGGSARPNYETPEPTYATEPAHDLNLYLHYMTEQVRELLTHYGPIAGIWLDGIAVPLRPKDASGQEIQGYDPRTDGDPFQCQALYDMIHDMQPQCLVSYKQGYLGTEDFWAPEHQGYTRFGNDLAGKPGEICRTAGGGWGYTAGHDYDTPDALWEHLTTAGAKGWNLLMNVGPLPDGSLPPAAATLREVGKRIQTHGFPA